jgi:glycosyltransferase involved in cell wall biosynthesis
MRVLVTTDAWHPQINGVVRSLEHTAAALIPFGVETEFLTPQSFRSIPLPTYSEIRLSLVRTSDVLNRLDQGRYQAVHIATEGPIGLAARRACLRRGFNFTTSYHTRFPEYVRARAPIPVHWTYAWLRRFHNAGAATMVATPTLRNELQERGFENLAIWPRGVDTDLFRPEAAKVLHLPRPIFLYVGRLAIEKNVDAFLNLDLPGTKVVVGDGPQWVGLQDRFPAAVFLGPQTGEDLATIYASADAFVFPSRTDTYGIVLLEALASGLPIAAYPVPGPSDVIGGRGIGVLDDDLRSAALGALQIPRSLCRAAALTCSWSKSAEEFLAHIVPLSGEIRHASSKSHDSRDNLLISRAPAA